MDVTYHSPSQDFLDILLTDDYSSNFLDPWVSNLQIPVIPTETIATRFPPPPAATSVIDTSQPSWKQSKRKKSAKKINKARVIVVTESFVDLVGDGYRWRKYGEKGLKNTSRGYYRCAYPECGVKKTVERCCSDPRLVINTYEGNHKHVRPYYMPHSGQHFGLGSAVVDTMSGQASATRPQHPLQRQQQYTHEEGLNALEINDHHVQMSAAPPHDLQQPDEVDFEALEINDHGLLQDIVASCAPRGVKSQQI